MAAPLGNQNAVKARKWSNAIERALNAFPDKPVSLEVNRGLDAAAHEFVLQVMTQKDVGFFREFGDRIDGKAPQAITGGDGGSLSLTITPADAAL
jgi:hypothetical protein